MVAGEVLDFVFALAGVLADELGVILDSTLVRTLDDVVNKVDDEDDVELDGLGDTNELEGLDKESQLV